MNLVIVPFHDWKKCEREGFRTRDAHLMQEFGRNPIVKKVLVVNRPISFAEIVVLRRNWRVKRSKTLIRKAGIYLSQVDDKIFTLDIVVPQIIRPLLMRRRWIPEIFGQIRMRNTVEFSLRSLHMEDSYALFISSPLFVPLALQLSPDVFAFDALDNLTKHASCRNIPGLAGFYESCLDKADLIFANSMETTRWFARKRPDATCILNGVDTEMFNLSRPYPLPSDMAAIPRPIVGYAGKMQEMFDVSLMKYVISENPGTSFVFIGQKLDSKWVKPLWQYPNVYYLGDKPYTLLPQYLSAFDVCIIPYSLERQHGGDPIKFYEYLAMGKPVVTTDIGNVGEFKDYPQVFIAQDTQEFLGGLRFFLKKSQQGKYVEIKPLPDSCLWKNKAHKILSAIAERGK